MQADAVAHNIDYKAQQEQDLKYVNRHTGFWCLQALILR